VLEVVKISDVNPALVRLYDSFGLDISYAEMHERCTDWNPKLPLSPSKKHRGLPKPVREIFFEHANAMYIELQKNQHSVGKDPAPDPQHDSHGIHVVRSMAPRWYSEIYWSMAEPTARVYLKNGGRAKRPAGQGKPHFVEVSNCKRGRMLRSFKRILNCRDGEYSEVITDKPKKWQPDKDGKLVHWRKARFSTLFETRRKFVYDTLLRDKIHERLTVGYHEGKDWVPGDVRVCTFWGLEDDLMNILLTNNELGGLTNSGEIRAFEDLGGLELKATRKSVEPPLDCPF
jgi:hypothetical protein